VTGAAQETCVVTGATSGIGRSLTVSLASRGAMVWALGRNPDRLAALAAEVDGLPGSVVPIVADLARDDDIYEATRCVLAETSRVDVLVHSAGTIVLGAFESVQRADFDTLYRVNLRAPFVLTQDLLPALRSARGQIVFVNSSAGLRASALNALYAATKHGLKAMADGLRDEVNPDGVRVISVYPGRTATAMQQFVHDQEGRDYRPELLLRAEDVVQVVLAALAVPRSGEVTDVSVRPMAMLTGGLNGQGPPSVPDDQNRLRQ
jgi:NADP-dependent 3-hydroxy acid dehydrogenase YdfG